MPTLNVFIGNVGSGKSLLASRFAKMGNVVCNMDSITRMVGGGECGLYDNAKKDVYHAAEEAVITKALEQGLSVVIDRTNMERKRRQRFIAIGKKYAREIIAYDWGRGENEQIERRLGRPNGIPRKTWEMVYNFMRQSYEPPTLDEGFSRIIEAPKSFKFYAFDFDGTIVENKFPDIGEIIEGTVVRLNKLWEDISNLIIIWTCRGGDFEHQMRAFLLKNKIPFDFINENPMCDFGSPKIFAHEYHDDRGVNHYA